MMNAVNNLLKGLFLLLLLPLAACSTGDEKGGALNQSAIRKLVNERFHGLQGLQQAVVELYVSAINKDWSSVYHLRDKSIRRFADEDTFVATMEQKMSDFSLKKLEFQMIETTRSPSGDVVACRVVMRVVQDPHAREHTAVVNWSKESGDWKSDSTGLRGSPLLQATGRGQTN